jgi:V/A-type H+-transporting ATPase subunit D
MTGLRSVPPGRAGRTWLVRRLQTAQRGADLLERKLRFLQDEQRRFQLLTRRTGTEWDERCRDAERWLLRATLLSGQRGVRLTEPGEPAEVRLTWAATMGVRYPRTATCRFHDPPPTAATPGNAALIAAVAASREAVAAAVRHAAADAALRTVAAEAAATRRRRRAVRDRWIPRITEALSTADLELEEQEHADGTRLRWAARRG